MFKRDKKPLGVIIYICFSFIFLFITRNQAVAADSYLSVMTETYHKFYIANDAGRNISFVINNKEYMLSPGSRRQFKFRKCYGTNSGNVQCYDFPKIYASDPDLRFKETTDGGIILYSAYREQQRQKHRRIQEQRARAEAARKEEIRQKQIALERQNYYQHQQDDQRLRDLERNRQITNQDWKSQGLNAAEDNFDSFLRNKGR